jgi:hypothetical protein
VAARVHELISGRPIHSHGAGRLAKAEPRRVVIP